MAIHHIGQCIEQFPLRSDINAALKYKHKHEWKTISWKKYYSMIEKTADLLLSLNINPQDRVAIFSSTRYEWSVCDLAILGIHAVTVPIYPNNTVEDVEYIINDSKCKIIFCENKSLLKLLLQIKEKTSSIEHIFVFDKVDSEYIDFDQIQKRTLQHSDKFKKLVKTIDPLSMATLVYTSGTTGSPKGVVITHEGIISEVGESFPLCGVTPKDVSLSFLPYAHVLGRIEHWGHTYIGFTMAYAESIEKIKSNLLDIKPTILVSVPRIFEKIYSAILAQIETQFIKKQIFDLAIDIALEVGEIKLKHQTIPLQLLAKYELSKKLVLNKITNAFGGRLKFAISGGAPIQKDIAKFFHSCGILILEGYGLTETCAAICVNTPFNYKFGSVGRPIGDVQIKIAEDGEILVKSKKVMKEYYNNPQATSEVFNNGWFCTGDIGEVLPSGDIKITDRKKDLIKTAGGKYVAPQRLEALLKLHPIIGHVLIHGDQKKYVVALVTLDRMYLKQWAQERNLNTQPWEEFIQNSEIHELVKKAFQETNSHLASFESIKKFHILPVEFTIENGDLTPSLKVKRKLLDKKYSQIIESLYD